MKAKKRRTLLRNNKSIKEFSIIFQNIQKSALSCKKNCLSDGISTIAIFLQIHFRNQIYQA